MHVRILNFSGAKDIDAGVTFLREKILPALSQQRGYRGLTASADRSSGAFEVLTLWDTPEDREASFDALASLRKEGEPRPALGRRPSPSPEPRTRDPSEPANER